MFCQQCGKQIKDDAVYCTHCGARNTAAKAVSTTTTPAVAAPDQRIEPPASAAPGPVTTQAKVPSPADVAERRAKAEAGDVSAQTYLGAFCFKQKDYRESVKWLRLAADQGYGNAETMLAMRYQFGHGVEQSDGEAISWYRRAADQGVAEAQCRLAYFYWSGRTVALSLAEAARLFRLAAEQGNAEAQGKFGWFCLEGDGVAVSYDEAVKWLRLAADHGDPFGLHCLGYCYQHGKGVAQSDTDAARWFRLAADKGNPLAQCDLGVCYLTGKGVAPSGSEAARLFRLAADQGYAEAQARLGVCYAEGADVPRSDSEAVRLARLAADQGNDRGQFLVGLFYEQGRGVPQSREEAARWYHLAADQGFEPAKTSLAVLARGGNADPLAPVHPSSCAPAVFCQACGRKIPGDSAYCGECGAAVAATPRSAPPGPVAATPYYGYYVEQTPNQITITVPTRSAPSNTAGAALNGCGYVLGLVLGVPLGAGMGWLVGALGGSGAANAGAALGGLVVAGIIVLAAAADFNKRSKETRPFQQAIIDIQRANILINGTAYSRDHVRDWTTRWTEPGGHSTVAVGSTAFVAGAMFRAKIDAEAEKRKALYSYQITFDYGHAQVMAVGGLTESSAARVMEAIQSALYRMV